jgi:hypothetical protein
MTRMNSKENRAGFECLLSLNLRSRGQYDWHSLDTWVSESQKHNVQLDYVFVNTPLWASTRPNEPSPALANGSDARHLPT